MHKYLVILASALALAACASAVAAPGTQPSLKAASDAYFLASRSADTRTAELLLADDHLFIGPTGKVQDKPARLAWLKENQDWLPTVTTRDVQVSQFGQTGRVTGIWVIPDAGSIVLERFIHVWVLTDGRWRMISHQVTVIPGDATPK